LYNYSLTELFLPKLRRFFLSLSGVCNCFFFSLSGVCNCFFFSLSGVCGGFFFSISGVCGGFFFSLSGVCNCFVLSLSEACNQRYHILDEVEKLFSTASNLNNSLKRITRNFRQVCAFL